MPILIANNHQKNQFVSFYHLLFYGFQFSSASNFAAVVEIISLSFSFFNRFFFSLFLFHVFCCSLSLSYLIYFSILLFSFVSLLFLISPRSLILSRNAFFYLFIMVFFLLILSFFTSSFLASSLFPLFQLGFLFQLILLFTFYTIPFY